METIKKFFSSDGFMPHGHCYLWQPDVLWLHILSDALITLAYYSIPFALVYFFWKRKDLRFGWMFLCFATFIFACGTTHLMEIWAIWHPTYYLTGAVKAMTAIASVPTAVLLMRLVPRALEIPGIDELERVNLALNREVRERKEAEAEVRELNRQLEARVQERTLQLEEANRSIKVELAERQMALERQEVFFSLTRHLSATRDRTEAARSIAQASRRLFQWDALSIDLYDGATDTMEPVLTIDTIGEEAEEVPPAYKGSSPSPLARNIIEHGPKLILRKEGEVESQSSGTPFGNTSRLSASLMFVPIRAGSEVIGVISAQSYETDAYGSSELDLLVAVSDLCGGAVERIRAEELLHDREARYRSLVAATSSVVWTCNASGRFVTPQEAWESFTGQSWEQHQGWGWADALHEEDREGIRARWEAAVKEHGLYESEGRLWNHRLGEYRYFVARGVPLFDEDGSVREWVGTVTDVHERKRAELLLQQTQERLASFLKCLPGMAFMKSTEGRYVYVNPQWEQYFGIPLDQATGRKDLELFPPEIADGIMASDESVLNHGQMLQNLATITMQGCPHHWIISKFVVGTPAGEERLLGGVGIDITARREAEQEVKRLNAELEQRVNERTFELTAANRELEAFSYSVSHDLRSPLRAIDGFSQAVLEEYGDKLDETGRSHLQRVRSATQRMGQLIDDLLVLSRVTRAEMNPSKVDLSFVAAEVIEELRNYDPKREVNAQISPGLCARVDERLLRVMLENLLGNAWKFTRQQEEARIEVGQQQDADGRVFYVRDNGAGFDMAYAGKLFHPFQRLHRASEYEGTGIGLATVRRVVERHGGRIWVEATLDKGATFYFTLPEA